MSKARGRRPPRCIGTTKTGERCKGAAQYGTKHCGPHQDQGQGWNLRVWVDPSIVLPSVVVGPVEGSEGL